MTNHIRKILEYKKACDMAGVEPEDLEVDEDDYVDLMKEIKQDMTSIMQYFNAYLHEGRLGTIYGVNLVGTKKPPTVEAQQGHNMIRPSIEEGVIRSYDPEDEVSLP